MLVVMLAQNYQISSQIITLSSRVPATYIHAKVLMPNNGWFFGPRNNIRLQNSKFLNRLRGVSVVVCLFHDDDDDGGKKEPTRATITSDVKHYYLLTVCSSWSVSFCKEDKTSYHRLMDRTRIAGLGWA